MPVVGGPSGTGLEHPESLAQLAAELGLDDVVRFVPPVAQAELARWYAAATLVAVPSYNESFGLVAAEAQAAGTPVVAAAVGGLTTVVRDGRSGLLVEGHEPADWADALRRVARRRRPARAAVGRGALAQARRVLLGADRRATLEVYERAAVAAPRGRCLSDRREPVSDPPQVIRDHLTEQRDRVRGGRRRRLLASPCPGRSKLADAGPARRRRRTRSAVHAFVCRKPDENHERVYRWLLERNLRMYAVSFAVDRLGDIYLDGRLPLAAVTPDELDRLLGSVLTYADESFNTILELGFASSIRKEWEWRKLRGRVDAQPRGVPRLAGDRGRPEPSSASTRLTQHRDEREQRRQRLHERIRRLTVAAPYSAGHDHAGQEEDLHVGAGRRPGPRPARPPGSRCRAPGWRRAPWSARRTSASRPNMRRPVGVVHRNISRTRK